MINLSNKLLMGGGAAPDFNGWSLVGTSEGTYTTAYPSGIQAGDLIVACSYRSQSDEDGYPGWNTWSGFTLIQSGNFGSSGAGYKGTYGHAYRIASAAHSGNVSGGAMDGGYWTQIQAHRPPAGFSFQSLISHTMSPRSSGTLSTTPSSANYPLAVFGVHVQVKTEQAHSPVADVGGLHLYDGGDPETTVTLPGGASSSSYKFLSQFSYG